MELYACVPGGILRWRQEGDGKKPVRAEGVDAPVRPGTLRALATSAEHTTLFFTDLSGDLCAWRPGEKPVTLLASAGPGPVSAVRCVIEGHDCTVLAQRSASGRVAFAAYPTEQESAGAWWTESGPPLPADAMVSVALDEHDEVVAASLAVGRDGAAHPPQGRAGARVGGLEGDLTAFKKRNRSPHLEALDAPDT